MNPSAEEARKARDTLQALRGDCNPEGDAWDRKICVALDLAIETIAAHAQPAEPGEFVTVPRRAKRWPFVESPGAFAERLAASIANSTCGLLPAVRHVLIENPPEIAAAPPTAPCNGERKGEDAPQWRNGEERPADGAHVAYLFEPFGRYYTGIYDAESDSVAGRSGFTTWQPEITAWYPLPPRLAPRPPAGTVTDAGEAAAQQGALTVNPYSGTPRDPRDIASDPEGLLIRNPDEPLRPAESAAPAVTDEAVEAAVSAYYTSLSDNTFDKRSHLRAALNAAFPALTAERDGLAKEVERLKVRVGLQERAIDRWVPCPDHRDKTERGQCYVCRNETLEREAEALRADAAYLRWRLDEILPLFEEARDALPAITETARALRGISPTLADRMDVAGTRTRDQFNAARKDG